MKAKEILKRKFGAEAPQIENEITERINEASYGEMMRMLRISLWITVLRWIIF